MRSTKADGFNDYSNAVVHETHPTSEIAEMSQTENTTPNAQRRTTHKRARLEMKLHSLLVSAAFLAGTAECFAPYLSSLSTFNRQASVHEAPTRSRKRSQSNSTQIDSDTPGAATASTAAEGYALPPPPHSGLPPRLQAAVDMLGQDIDLTSKSKLIVELGDAFAKTAAAVLPLSPPTSDTIEDTVVAEASTSASTSADGWYTKKVPGCVSEVYVAVRVENNPATSRQGAATVDDTLGAGGGGGVVSIRGTADARLSRGLLALLALGLQGQSSRTVLSLRGSDLAAAIGMRAGLTDSRINGLGNILGVIQDQVLEHFRNTAAAAASAAARASSILPPNLAYVAPVQGATPQTGRSNADLGKAFPVAADAPAATLPASSPRAVADAKLVNGARARAADYLTAAAATTTTEAAGRSSSSITTASRNTAGLDPTRNWGDDASSWYPLPGAENEVAMLLSGGVDSSVALRLLQEKGYKIRAFYLKIWLEDELAHLNQCPWEEDLAYATAVCEQAGVPLEVVPLQKEYWDEVVSYTLSEARAGRTPNPDVMCNSRIKFGMFYNHVGKHFRYVATGHYAKLERFDDGNVPLNDSDYSAAAAVAEAGAVAAPAETNGGRVRLSLSPDANKDQTYFLCTLTQDQLQKALFPVGMYTKDQIRELAMSYDLPTKNRKDSQGICFLGKLKFDEFLLHYLGTSPGMVVDQYGNDIGTHNGLWFHTIGQRRGVGNCLFRGEVNRGPWYVAEKDMENNVLVVTNDLEEIAVSRDVFRVEALRWNSGRPPAELAREGSMRFQVKTRHGPNIKGCVLRLVPLPTKEGCETEPIAAPARSSGVTAVTTNDEMAQATRGYVKLDSEENALAPGQFAAFYIGDVCVGSGVMCGWSIQAALAHGVFPGGKGTAYLNRETAVGG